MRAMNQRDFFFQRHLAQQLVHSRIPRHRGNGLCRDRHAAKQQRRSC